MEITPIAVIRTDFDEKFGIPRQSGRAPSAVGRIELLPKYRDPDALRGLEGFSHLWLIFDFSESHRSEWSPTVRPPRLGGNKRIGVFASRSPFRPNPIGLSCVKIESIGDGVITVSGCDLLDGTPIFDIKPYLPSADCGGLCRQLHRLPARGGFPAGAFGAYPGGQEGGSLRVPRRRPPPLLSARPGAGVQYALCGVRYPLYRFGGYRQGNGSGQGELT